MSLIQTGDITPETVFSKGEGLQTYCGLDCCITVEVLQALQAQFNQPPAIYQFEKALQGPYMEIMLRGFRVAQRQRAEAALALRARISRLELTLQEMARTVWFKGLNVQSPKQLQEFFYGSLKLPEQWISQKGVRKLSTNREALEKLEIYLHARPIISCILTIRDLAKQLQVFETEIDPDGRFRTSYNIAGTETGRPSSSENAFGTGGNAQNIAPTLRHVFVSDPGYKLCVIDLEQVEARDVGFFIGILFNDWTFLDSCESGDLHSSNAKLIWPELPWTGDRKRDRAIADQNFYRDFSYRDMAKRGSHLSNYSGTAWTASRALKVPLEIMEEFQARYCRGRKVSPSGLPEIVPAFPGIPRWWQWVGTELQSTGFLVTPFGRKRHFFGRPGDDTTLREAIAFLPQSTTADRMNLGLWRVWKYQPQVQLLAQTYDSITFQAKEGPGFDDEVAQALALVSDIPIFGPSGRRYSVPGEAKIGWNWGAASPTNPDGLVKWGPSQDDLRTRQVKDWGTL